MPRKPTVPKQSFRLLVPRHVLEAARKQANSSDLSLAQFIVRAMKASLDPDAVRQLEEQEVVTPPAGVRPRPLPVQRTPATTGPSDPFLKGL